MDNRSQVRLQCAMLQRLPATDMGAHEAGLSVVCYAMTFGSHTHE